MRLTFCVTTAGGVGWGPECSFGGPRRTWQYHAARCLQVRKRFILFLLYIESVFVHIHVFLLPPLPSLARHVTPCSNGHMRTVKLLLRAGAAVNSENAKGQVNSGLGSNGSCFRVPRSIIAPQIPSVILVCATTRAPADTCRLGLPAQLQ